MNPHLYNTLRWLPNVAGALTFLLVVFVGLVAWDTLKDDSRRITMHEGFAKGYLNDKGELVVTYNRGFTVNRAGDGVLFRKVACVCPKGQIDEFDLPTVQRWFDETTYPPVTRWLDTPMKVSAGTRCTLYVYGQWRHRFAVTAKHYLLDQMDFVVEATHGA